MLVLGFRISRDHARERRAMIGSDTVLEVESVIGDTVVLLVRAPKDTFRVRLPAGATFAILGLAAPVEVTVVRIGSNKVRLGFTGPRSVAVLREERLSASEIEAFERALAERPAKV